MTNPIMEMISTVEHVISSTEAGVEHFFGQLFGPSTKFVAVVSQPGEAPKVVTNLPVADAGPILATAAASAAATPTPTPTT